jgi:5-methylcytosine-specific restriction enzyme B
MVTLAEIYEELKIEEINWKDGYKEAVNEIKKIREKLTNSEDRNLKNKEIYADNKFASNYEDFIEKLIYKKDNGIASKGQSILSKENFNKLISDEKFINIIRNIILDPTKEKYIELANRWKELIQKKNPVIINRIFAACNPEKFSSVIDEGKFGAVVNLLATDYNFNIETITEEKTWWCVANKEVTEFVDRQLEEKLKNCEDKIVLRNIFLWCFYDMNSYKFLMKKQNIKYGAPGTGKTFTCKTDIKNHFFMWKVNCNYKNDFKVEENSQIVQFHPSFSYEDFFEGIRPIINNGNTELQLTNGVFKEFCKKAAKWEISLYNEMPEIKDKNWSDIKVKDIKGKLNNESWSFLNEIKDEELYIENVIPPFYFIIDEINRAELSRVLGELMYCLEYRGYNGKIKTQYSQLAINKSSYFFEENEENYFFIPNNVYILGTMNNIDRSVDSFDFALRRRFSWTEVEPQEELILNNAPKDWKYKESIANKYNILNDKISKDHLLGKDYRIGHSYLMNLPEWIYQLKETKFCEVIWNEKLKPLLEEYLRGSSEYEKVEEYRKIFCGE